MGDKFKYRTDVPPPEQDFYLSISVGLGGESKDKINLSSKSCLASAFSGPLTLFRLANVTIHGHHRVLFLE